jgi:hypothetical protein
MVKDMGVTNQGREETRKEKPQKKQNIWKWVSTKRGLTSRSP